MPAAARSTWSIQLLFVRLAEGRVLQEGAMENRRLGFDLLEYRFYEDLAAFVMAEALTAR